MNLGEIGRELEKRFDGFVRVVQATPDLVVEVAKGKLLETCRFLKDTPDFEFNFLIFITAVDRGDYLEVVYCLRSMSSFRQILLKVQVPADNPEVPSLNGIWPAANFDERETYDLLGVKFTGHPDLTRILLPDDWEGFPLRKSYPVDKRPARVY